MTVAQILALVIFVVMFVMIVMEHFERQNIKVIGGS